MLADPRVCPSCTLSKPLSEFYVYNREVNGRSKKVTSGYCKTCTKSKAKQRKATMTVEQREREHRRKVLNVHGLSVDEYECRVAAQNGCCAICGKAVDGNLCVDHCHETGGVRGLLCKPCNFGLGLFGDDPERLRRAADYLETS